MATSCKGKTPRRVNFQSNNENSAPLEVYCRIRPMHNETEETSITVMSDNTIQLTPPGGPRHFNNKEVKYVFRHIFNTDSTQKQVYNTVAHPLVKNLLHGKNGLLLAYGVTGSGKTYTMNGTSSDGGVMARCIDVIFNSVSKYQPPKNTFKPDKLNGYEIQSDADIMLQKQSEMFMELKSKTPGKAGVELFRRARSDPEIEINRIKDADKITDISEDNAYSVFVSYVEIYNNSVFDLLESVPEKGQFSNRILREDGEKNMFVHGMTEVEVRSPEEAFQIFQKGQSKKKMAKTICNSESSRSHSIFIIRLVQAPLDETGEQVVQDKRALIVSQLSLVDLAGSERVNRTNVTSGQRLREAGNINNSLMTLRTCLEILRDNQAYNTNKNPPYRESKLTHLFKSYFTGDGFVRMIVCVNPRSEDYDENLAVMKFAEMTQEVQITKATPMRLDFGLTPGRRKFNETSKKVKEVLNFERREVNKNLPPIDSGILYSFAPEFPPFDSMDPRDNFSKKNLLVYLETRRKKEKELISDCMSRSGLVRMSILEMDQKVQMLNCDRASFQNRVEAAEKKAIDSDAMVTTLNIEVGNLNATVKSMRNEIEHKDMILQKYKMEKEKSQEKIKINKNKLSQKFQSKLKDQADAYEHELRHNEKRIIHKVKNIIDSQLPDSESSCSSSASSTPRTRKPISGGQSSDRSGLKRKENTTQVVASASATSTVFTVPRRPMAVSNPRRRRSRSAGAGKEWLHHQPITSSVETGTIFQPTNFNKRKSVTKLTDARDVCDPKTAKYSLLTQDQNTDGELETHLYKADVLPTVGGGAQVVFNDVETLKQSSPTSSPVRKRVALINALSLENIQDRCRNGVEKHSPRT